MTLSLDTESGELPPGWARETIANLCDVNPRGFDDEPEDDDFVSQVPMASVEAETGRMDASLRVRYGDFKKKSLTRFQENDVLFAKITPCMENGKITKARGLVGGRALGSTEFHVLRSRGAVLPEYLTHYLLQRNVRITAEHHMSGAVGQRRVPRPYLESLEIPVPPLAEQRRIVAALDHQIARIEAGAAALGEAEQQISILEATLLATATKSHPDVSSWGSTTIGEIANVSSGATPLKGNSAYYEGGTVPWVTSSLLNSPFIHQADKFITELAVKETAVREYDPGTILVAMYGEGKTRGKCSELRINATTNQACAAIQLHSENESRREWLKALLESLYEENRALASGGVQPNLSLALIKKIRVPLPPSALQTKILEELAQRRAQATAMATALATARVQAQELRSALLHSAFSGALVPQDPTDEPASTVLNRIRAERASNTKAPRKRAPRRPRTAPPGQEELPQ
ncbi:restriction endonuclease subunit S [Streptomyces sp. NPDC021212]|uniref:restriction endonuclease subunit S n=1 Tax=Streptomyces sp. NPDC021212 TaxID=3365118 RepID=UPI00379E2E85